MKPVIRVFQRNGEYIYKCDYVNKVYGQNLIRLKAIFYVLKMLYYLEKDENGQYKHTQ